MIELVELEAMFENIAAGPKWDMGKPMLWGYFFRDPSAQKLETVAAALFESGYRFVKLFDAEYEDEKPCFLLHVEREEVHSPQSLHEQNTQFEALAERYALLSYDGMDVGPLAVK